jgi:pyruvate kinase
MTDIIATIGPASGDVATLAEMIRSGMSVARMNFSHGDYAFHARTASLVREASALAGQPTALLADLQGAKVRVGRLDREIPVEDGQLVLLVGLEVDVRERPETLPVAAIVPVDFDLAPHVKPGGTILIDDGNLELKIEGVVAGHVHCRVVHGGLIKSRKGVNVPYTLLPIPALTEKDRADAAFAVSLGVDWIALSFAGTAADVTELREIVAAAEGHSYVHTPPRIMAKIERPRRCGEPARDHRRQRRRDGGPGRPGAGDQPVAVAAAAKADRAGVPAGAQAGGGGDADAGEHDPESPAHPRRGERRGQRAARRR